MFLNDAIKVLKRNCQHLYTSNKLTYIRQGKSSGVGLCIRERKEINTCLELYITIKQMLKLRGSFKLIHSCWENFLVHAMQNFKMYYLYK